MYVFYNNSLFFYSYKHTSHDKKLREAEAMGIPKRDIGVKHLIEENEKKVRTVCTYVCLYVRM